jgi:rare lipoprotein A
MKRFWILCTLLTTIAACNTSEATRRKISASGDPEDIFFEKTIKPEEKAIAESVQEDLKPDTVAKFDIPAKTPDKSGNFDEIGYTSWYGSRYQGKPTASGEPFDANRLTAAHRTLPMGSIVKVHNLENQKEAMVRVNDRGPFVDGRVIDVSEKTAEILDFKDKGVTKVGLIVVKKGDGSEKFEDLDDGSLDEEADLLDEGKPEKLTPKKDPVPVTKSGDRPKGYTVQVGVFKDQNRALKYKELMKNEYSQEVFLYSRDDGFVVQMGDFASKEKAEALKSKLRYDGIECFIPKR